MNFEMNTVADALYQIKYNPFKYGEYMASFYSTIENVENNLLIAQIVIPLCSHPKFKKKLEGAVFGENRKSSIWTIFKDRAELYDLKERIDEFRTLTEQSIHYCLVNDWLTIDKENLMIVLSFNIESIFRKQKNAENLGKLLSGLKIIEIYSFFGVKNI